MQPSRQLSTADRIGICAFDQLVERGITAPQAALLGQAVRAELTKRADLTELFAVRVIDHAGEPHAVIARTLSPGRTPLFRFDISRMRQEVERRTDEISR